MVVEVAEENQQRVERVYCLKGIVTVTCLMPGSTKSVTLNTVGEYVKIEEVNNDCKFTRVPPNNIPLNVKNFIEELEKIAETAGWIK